MMYVELMKNFSFIPTPTCLLDTISACWAQRRFDSYFLDMLY